MSFRPASADDDRARKTEKVRPVPLGNTGIGAGISRAHDERRDRQRRLEAAGWRAIDLVGPVCARLVADPAVVLAGGRTHAESRARAVVAHVACDGVGLPVGEVAALLGVSGTAISAARRRGRDVLAANAWTVEGVLGWAATP